ncbi:MAG TPA: RagB/SusD family nutrient uptake outer membrane protein [Niabella sp.]|nr:RagB/SusD family nutrient uptake outer membrane protein [Niabella sp.]HOZ95709.1 RagB/SusD family nutrient uptake outer membrane protein [Niabella sp.]HQW15952.1 RagB/SusD family nutrient uptake outer membrane protein [Niabella sp.]HQX21195.1 RagB/SusD family nutrient uptake outer membrane protein [Niabella sp.]HRB06470.1 RagB/SusD family nutrient uptake outer membrane protein [Niabella sp.]
MKKLNILILSIVVLGMLSCKKDFLDRAPLTAISDADYWKTPNDLRFYTNAFYSSLPSYIQAYFTAGIFSEDDNTSDNMVNRNYSRFLNGESTLPASGGGWSYADWNNIRRTNYFLGKYQSATGDQAEINKYLGEVLFFKANFYYSKLKQFGAVPWISKVLTVSDSTDLYAPRLPRNVVVDSIMNILDKAISVLPSKGASGYEPFRVYKEVAALLQSRIALYEGTWEKYHAGTPYGVSGSNGSKYLQKAADAAQIVINSNKFGLENVGISKGYWNLFNQLDYSGSNEVMFWRKYSVADGNYTLIARYITMGGGRGITKNLVESYLCTDGKPISVSPLYQGDATLINVATNRDPRLSQTVQINDGLHYLSDTSRFWHPAWGGAAEDKDYTGYQLYKGLNSDSKQQAVAAGTQGTIYFRYAEALLNLIEAKAELGTASQADVDATINKLRARVGMPNLVIASIVSDPNWEFSELSPIINEVRRERRVELAVEGYRHDDIWRWAAAGKLIKGWKPLGAKRAQYMSMPDAGSSGLTTLYPVNDNDYIFPYKNNVVGASGYNFKIERDYLSPLSTEQLTLNPQLTQNPGW